MQQKYCTAQKCHKIATAEEGDGLSHSFPRRLFGLPGAGVNFA
jgi:hypothetical protein